MKKKVQIEVTIDYRPKRQGKKFNEWCERWGCDPLNGGRQAWCSRFGTYLRDGIGIAYTECGEAFIIYEEDLRG